MGRVCVGLTSAKAFSLAAKSNRPVLVAASVSVRRVFCLDSVTTCLVPPQRLDRPPRFIVVGRVSLVECGLLCSAPTLPHRCSSRVLRRERLDPVASLVACRMLQQSACMYYYV